MGPLISHDFPLEGKQNWLWLLISSRNRAKRDFEFSFFRIKDYNNNSKKKNLKTSCGKLFIKNMKDCLALCVS